MKKGRENIEKSINQYLFFNLKYTFGSASSKVIILNSLFKNKFGQFRSNQIKI